MMDDQALALAGYRRLACALLLQAYQDAKGGNGQDARQFLLSDGARWLVDLLDLDGAGLDVAMAGLPRPTHKQLALFG